MHVHMECENKNNWKQSKTILNTKWLANLNCEQINIQTKTNVTVHDSQIYSSKRFSIGSNLLL
jgi:hypothetical protein